MLSSAILAGGMIAQQNILPRERASLERNVYVFRQPNYRGRMNRQFRGVKHVAVVLFHAGDAFKDHYYRAPFVAHVDWLKGSVQH
jgi:hypothetical protein